MLTLILLTLTNLATPDSTIVDSEWMARALSYDYKSPPTQLVNQFAHMHSNWKLWSDSIDLFKPYLNITIVNLDDDPEPEYIIFIGPWSSNTMFCVVKHQNKVYRLVHAERLQSVNEEPELTIMNTSAVYKTFCLEWFYFSGLDEWLETYRFYKVIDDQLVLGLEFVRNAQLSLGVADLNGNMETVSISESSQENTLRNGSLYLDYNYSISTGCYFGDPTRSKVQPAIMLFQGHGTAIYSWDTLRSKYTLTTSAKANDLTQNQADSFMHLAEDSVFVSAFSERLKSLVKTGTPDQIRAARYFLKKHK
jgi:hypothetical protein